MSRSCAALLPGVGNDGWTDASEWFAARGVRLQGNEYAEVYRSGEFCLLLFGARGEHSRRVAELVGAESDGVLFGKGANAE